MPNGHSRIELIWIRRGSACRNAPFYFIYSDLCW